MTGTPDDSKRADVLVTGSTLYLLNDRGFNRWSAQVQPGQDDDGKRITDEECAAVAGALASSQRKREPVDLSRDRTPQDYAIEHAEYMAVRAERLLDAVQEHAAAHLAREDDGNDQDDDEDISSLNERCDRADEGVTEAMAKMRDGIQEFRKRRDRAAIAGRSLGPAMELTSMAEGLEAITTLLDYLLREERAHAQTDWKGDTKASLVSALEIADTRLNLLEQIKVRILGVSATDDRFALTASGKARIDSAADALSKVMAFTKLGDMASTVERALSGLRSMQALATPQAVDFEAQVPAVAKAELTGIRMWHDRIKEEHPTGEPEYWPASLKAQYMEAEILELRAKLQAAGAKGTP